MIQDCSAEVSTPVFFGSERWLESRLSNPKMIETYNPTKNFNLPLFYHYFSY